MTTAFTHTRDHKGHCQPGHPERPERLEAILERLRGDAVWEALMHLDTESADVEEVRRVHSIAYLERVQTAVGQNGSRLDADTYTTMVSLEVALRALGNVFGATRAVLEGTADNAFAAVRPPGHHATPNRPMGFCLFSNVAIAARWAQATYGVERILIIDFDVHHGNGTQAVFYDDPNVLYLSAHQHPLYPGTGRADETGAGEGEGATVNVPLPPGTGDKGYQRAFRRVLTPVAERFDPELIFLSAGYDAHAEDVIASMNLTVAGFAALVHDVMGWADQCADGRLVAVLEGGYHRDALAHSVLTTVRRLTDPDAEPHDPFGPVSAAQPDVTSLLDDLAGLHHVA